MRRVHEREVIPLLVQTAPEERVLVDGDDSDGSLEVLAKQVGQILVLLADLEGRGVVRDAFVDGQDEFGPCGRRREQRDRARRKQGSEQLHVCPPEIRSVVAEVRTLHARLIYMP